MKLHHKFDKYLLLLLLISVFSLGATAQKKVALLIGNSTYLPSADNATSQYNPLPLCVNDVETIGSILESLDFHTIILKDGNKAEMLSSLSQFRKYLKGADVAVFYYSGHANYLNGEYYLIPAKTEFTSVALSEQLLQADNIKEVMTDNSKLSLLFFDACRNIVQDTSNKGGETIKPKIDLNNLTWDSKFNFQMFFPTEYGRKTKAAHETLQLSPFSHVVSQHLKDGGDFNSIVWHNIRADFHRLTGEMADCQGSYRGSFCFNKEGEQAPQPNVAKSQTEKRNKKYVAFVCDAPNATLRFGNQEFQAGDIMEFEIGKSYTYSVSAKGYEYYADRLTISSATPTKLQVTLRKAGQADLIVSCNTSARVYIDDEYVGSIAKGELRRFISTSGQHTIALAANGYYGDRSTVTLKKGDNFVDFTLDRDYGEFWEWDDYDGSKSVSYHFSPKYQIGLSYMYRKEYSRFSFGGIIAVSPGWFAGLPKMLTIENSVSLGSSSSSTIDINDSNGNIIAVQQETKTEDFKPKKYSEDFDPNHEAKYYEANALILGNVGFNITNGLLVEAGFGVGYHQDRYKMPFDITKTTTTLNDLTTGERIGEPAISYTRGAEDTWWLKESSKWSPALRLGGKALIPLDDWDEWFISVGGGYTWMITNHKYSSWDANLGIVWTF